MDGRSPIDWNAQAATLLARCDTLAAISSAEGRIARFPYTPEHRRCNDEVAAWMAQAGLVVHEDAVGNVWGRLEGNGSEVEGDRPRLVVGSHLDTVPNAGAYDGILGVLTGIAVAGEIAGDTRPRPFDLDVVGFADEEGARFGVAMFASQAVADAWNPDWLDATDREGTSLAGAARAFGLDPARIPEARAGGDGARTGFLELHIEQGPVLEDAGRPLGVVTAIAGARRFNVGITGLAGHAGTVPMRMRRDALAAAAEFTLDVESVARRFSIVGTVGRLECRPGAANVIAGSCALTLDIRAEDDGVLDAAIAELRQAADEISASRACRFTFDEYYHMPAVRCAPMFVSAVERACRAVTGDDVPRLPSGAGHDAMAMAARMPVGMIFMRCGRGGISHHPDECVDEADVALALAALHDAVLEIGASL